MKRLFDYPAFWALATWEWVTALTRDVTDWVHTRDRPADPDVGRVEQWMPDLADAGSDDRAPRRRRWVNTTKTAPVPVDAILSRLGDEYQREPLED